MSDNEQLKMLAERIDSHIHLAGKKVLEIGCGNGDLLKLIAESYDIAHITGVDSSLSGWWGIGESVGANWSVCDGNAERLCFDDNSFDAVISYAAFEHIENVKLALSEIKRVMKPYGRFYTEFSPIWTSIVGHHFVAKDETLFNPSHLKLIPPWGHLYMNELQMHDHLHEQTEEDALIDEILYFIYHSSIINRLGRNDFLDIIVNCGMIIKMYQETIAFNRLAILGMEKASELTADILKKIVSAGYDATDIGVLSMMVLLEKYESI
ncbi:MAG: methyltransferase domain-containing protein [Oscillospiraceae bacterium]|nr:methyltransferase domain-containing protein [Oscillospiraceae bacterium]